MFRCLCSKHGVTSRLKQLPLVADIILNVGLKSCEDSLLVRKESETSQPINQLTGNSANQLSNQRRKRTKNDHTGGQLT